VETPTTIQAVLEFKNKALITLGSSWDVWNHGHPNMEFYGTNGSLRIPDPKIYSTENSSLHPWRVILNPFSNGFTLLGK
jgi:predicted dehydrogenase